MDFSTEQLGGPTRHLLRQGIQGTEMKCFVLNVLRLQCLVDIQVGILTSQLSI